MKAYSKRTERASMGKEKHRVLIFGKRTYGSIRLDISLDLFNVELIDFPGPDYPKMKELSEYTLIILDYSVFSSEGVIGREKAQEIFQKQMLKALNQGTCFCFLHYDDVVPMEDKYNRTHGMNEEDVRECRRSQIGFYWLNEFDIKPIRFDQPVIYSRVMRNEFKKYMEQAGASRIIFESYGKEHFSDVIAGKKNYPLAFTLNLFKGKLIYLPCQRDFSRPGMLAETFTVLIDSLITYLTKSRMELPEWARIPIFDEEGKLIRQKAGLEGNLKECQERLDTFHSAKQLLFQSEYGLEEALPRFLQEQCEVSTERKETYREDFWLLDPSRQKVVICEAKSYVKGFRKSGLFSLYNHRESYDLNEGFPAVLFVNTHLNAASWKQKDKLIDKQDYEEAADKQILIVRIEDLLFAWQALRDSIIDANKLLGIFREGVGWLRFKKNRSWEILK